MPPSSNNSPRLDLPYLMPSQAQKHVTHNDALQRLDALVQLSLQALQANEPPVTPIAGEIHALGPAPQGVWSGQAGMLAVFDATAWLFLAPRTGWRGYDITAQRAVFFDGSDWQPERPDLSNLEGLGIGTGWDGANRLSVAAQASLFSHSGSGGHQVKINKSAAAETASLLFQSDWTGHAEIGLTGDTGLSLKISADGSSWYDAMKLDPISGETVLAPDGTVRARLTGSELELNVPLTGEAVQSSAFDDTPGRALRIDGDRGAFGLGRLEQPGATSDETPPRYGTTFRVLCERRQWGRWHPK